MEILQFLDTPSPLIHDPLNESCNLELLENERYNDLVSFAYGVDDDNSLNSKTATSNDSIIDLDFLDTDTDINLDILLNQDLDVLEECPQHFSDNNITDDNYFTAECIETVQINYETPKKNKRKSVLPLSIRDLDHFSQVDNRSNLKNQDLLRGKPGDRIYLTKEEKALLIRDGCAIPTHLPLTKSEERALKSVRRKIRNKISAKNSRAKKETYIDGLEQRIVICSNENSLLRQKLAETERDKMTLYQQVVNLQKKLAQFVPKSTVSSTSLMLLLLTFMIILAPSFDPRRLMMSYSMGSEKNNGKNIFPGRTRMLLQESEVSMEIGEPYLVTIKSGPPWQIPPKTPAVQLKAIMPVNQNPKANNVSLEYL